ncbi:EboA domain-containing protein [Ruania zhangjianzhongii]|uniref:EboA domain-containing protein n=1 Tax=Ruania zhangjianzhongii TaxID=2603206 RepID=UPI0011CC568A|nr:EboA domain-containing protein [Ruania zhangjianzhongii]
MTERYHAILADRLSPQAQDRLHQMTTAIGEKPAAIAVLFPAAAREVGRGPVDEGDPGGVLGPTLDDIVRGVLLLALAEAEPDPSDLLRHVGQLYRFGDSEERRAVLRALADLGLGQPAQYLVEDALRSNDVRLIGAAMGDWAGAHLEDAAWRQGVLKCLFVGVPLAAVARLTDRADAELARMVAAFAHERLAAGRTIPPDAHPILDLFPGSLEQFPDVGAALDSASSP